MGFRARDLTVLIVLLYIVLGMGVGINYLFKINSSYGYLAVIFFNLIIVVIAIIMGTKLEKVKE